MDAQEKTTLYLVTYEDEETNSDRIERIFSTREKAEAWIGPAAATYSVRESTLDDIGPDRPVAYWQAEIYLESGLPWNGREDRSPRVDVMPVGFREDFRNCRSALYPHRNDMVWARSTESFDRAMELAQAERAKWLEAVAAEAS